MLEAGIMIPSGDSDYTCQMALLANPVSTIGMKITMRSISRQLDGIPQP